MSYLLIFVGLMWFSMSARAIWNALHVQVLPACEPLPAGTKLPRVSVVIAARNEGGRIEEGARRLCTLLGNRPVSVEVTTNDAKGMLEQGRTFARWAPNVVVKIPVVNEYGDSCLGVIHTLSREGVPVNTTAILSFNQAILAAKAGATYLSIFAGRVSDEGNDPASIIRGVRIETIVLTDNRCVYDFMHVVPAAAFADTQTDFTQFVDTFRTE